MSYKLSVLLLVLITSGLTAIGQKPFAEGTITYRVSLRTADQKELRGVYTFTIKGGEIRKELKLNNGYEDVVLLNCITSKVYSLQNRNNKKYAIQLNMSDMLKRQEKFAGYTVSHETANDRNIAGFVAYKGNVSYKDGSNADVIYSKEWRPSQAITFERFPDAKFLPMYFSYKDENNMVMEFEVEKIEAGPIENSVFRIPADYQMISYQEYKQLSK